MTVLPDAKQTTPTSIDVEWERAQTAGVALASHFNAAGAALPSRAVVAAVIDHLRTEESIGGYEAAAQARAQLEALYVSAARLIGARPEEVALFDGASTGLRVLIDALRLEKPRRIIATSTTYVSHALHLLTISREREVEVVIAPTTPDRRIDLEALERLLAEGPPAIVTAAHIATSSGFVEPAAEIGALVRAHDGVYVLDATQSVGHLAIDVEAIGCDMLVTTGRKFLRAPRGTGFAYVSRDLAQRLAPAAPDVRGSKWISALDWVLDDSARRFETWEASIATRLGLGVALDQAFDRGSAATEEFLVGIGGRIRAGLDEIPKVTVVDPEGARSAIVTFVVAGTDASAVVAALAARGVQVFSVPATHGQWDLGDRGITAVVRASAHVYNDENDVDALLSAVASVTGEGRAGTA
jgi:selenocysteine lyase/cysteine desulfurase